MNRKIGIKCKFECEMCGSMGHATTPLWSRRKIYIEEPKICSCKKGVWRIIGVEKIEMVEVVE